RALTRLDRAGSYLVDGDAARGVVHRELAREADDAVLGRDVGGPAARAHDAGDGGDVHDAPGGPRQHLHEGPLAADERAGEVDSDHALPEGQRQLGGGRVPVENAGRVDHDPERPERGDGPGDARVHVAPAACVALEEARAPAARLDRAERLLAAIRQEVEHRDWRAASRQRLGDRPADAGAPARDERAATHQAHVPRNSMTAAAAVSGASCRTMWPPGTSKSAAPLTR